MPNDTKKNKPADVKASQTGEDLDNEQKFASSGPKGDKNRDVEEDDEESEEMSTAHRSNADTDQEETRQAPGRSGENQTAKGSKKDKR